MPVPLTDESRRCMCLAFLKRSADDTYAAHMATEARRYGATEQEIEDAYRTRAAFNAPTVIPARFDERYDPSPEPIDRRIA